MYGYVVFFHVVGKNGSGKSNVYDAIQFVLSEKYSGIRADARTNLLHEGAGRQVLSAYVELIFDNSDNRMPGQDKVVSLKRSIGVKKDEYFLNNAHATRQEVDSLLESSGISRSNPYYIVQQGKVAHLIKMHESERLELLKEIAGTRVYDDRRKESSKIMVDTHRRYAEIADILEGINKRLAELDDEKEELAEYQHLDRERRCLEFTLYDQELQKAAASLDEIEQRRAALNEKTNETHNITLDISNEITKLSNSISEFQLSLTAVTAEHARNAADLNRLTQSKTTLELDLADSEEAENSKNDSMKKYRSELAEVSKKVKETISRLDFLKTPHEELKLQEEQLRNELERNQLRLQSLYSRQNQASKYRTKPERDAAIKSELIQCEKMVKQPEKELKSLEIEIQNLEQENTRCLAEIAVLEAQLSKVQKEMEEHGPRLDAIKQNRDSLINSRKEIWRLDSEIDTAIRTKTEELRKTELALNSTLNKGTSTGLKILETVLAENNIAGVRGPLIDLIECDEKFNKCVETTASNRLFQIVVDNDDVVSEILSKMKKFKQGRLTFMPLNRLSRDVYDYPESKEHVVPLISQLRFEPKYKDAVNQIFGRTLIARSLQLASEYSRKLDFDCITLEGDQVNRKGAYSGGYVDARRSRLDLYRQMQTLKNDLRILNENSRDVKMQMDRKEQDVAQIYSNLQREEQNRGNHRNEAEQLRLSVQSLRTKASAAVETLKNKKQLYSKASHYFNELSAKIAAYREELNSPFSSVLTNKEITEIDSINKTLSNLQNQLAVIITEQANVQVEVQNLENLLQTNLSKRETELRALIMSESSDVDVSDLRSELKLVVVQTNELRETLKQLDAKKEDLNEKLNNSQQELDDLKSREQERRSTLSVALNQIEKLHSRKSVLESEKDESVRKIRELGALPAQAHSTEYRNLSAGLVRSRLEVCLQALGRFSAVNRKAIDQYLQFNEKRAELIARRDELTQGKSAIDDLILHLDQQKDEAIQRTFKGIATHFKDVFKKIVPDGHGSLVMMKSAQRSEDDMDEDEEKVPSFLQYTGVGIRVSFTGIDTVTSMQQLSGGQQTVVALALLFAIQLCDPSPFYFFDEIDAALDASYRTAIANMLVAQRSTTQFIVTTFRPEILNAADKYFKVEYANRISIPSVTNLEEAAEIIAEIESEEQSKPDDE